ncbi:endonuclease/exonuclease/phosphatase family protein [Palleronia rufa]|uniref:endonuclease/exonuclease/phosphatase family protein n=2 Tax=Palleronia rufa TaxID=1530186 RepID=UPI00056814E0
MALAFQRYVAALLLGACFAAPAAMAEQRVRVATFHTELSARGPGLLLAEVEKGSPRVDAVLAMIAEAAPDILVLQGIDYDATGAALGLLAKRIGLPHTFARRPNTGWATGLDLDQDGRLGDPRDAQGYGRFAGAGGMAVLSRWPILRAAAQDLSGLLWADLPGADLPPMAEKAREIQRLSSVAHWVVPVDIDGRTLRILTWHATPPVFDGPQDRNGRRNRDEAAVWLRLLDGELGIAPPDPPFVIAGIANLDPADGEGRRDALDALLADPRLADPRPESAGARAAADPGQSGDPALDTAGFDPPTGNLRLSYVLPSRDLAILGSGVLWPPPDSDTAARFGPPEEWSRHRLVWVDLALP